MKQLWETMRGLPDWLAWRLDAFATDARDERLLSSRVLDAFRGTVQG